MSRSLPNLLYDPQKYQKIIVACDCPCDDLVEVETPPWSVMVLSYIAQALVVTIVGLNMGFRWCVGIIYERGGCGRSCRYRLLWIKTEHNSTVGKKISKFGRKCSWRWKGKAPSHQFPVFPTIRICHCTLKRTENKKLDLSLYSQEDAICHCTPYCILHNVCSYIHIIRVFILM
jgi:hypothetical protein